jgi:hypothetical protein
MQRRLDRWHAELELGGDLLERMVEYVLEDHAAALRRRERQEAAERGLHRLLPGERVVGLELRGAGDLGRGLERLAAAHALVPPMVDRPVVGDAEQPGAQGRHLLELRQLVVRPGQRLLDHVLTVGGRAGHACAVAVQLRADVLDQRQELPPALLEHADEVARRRRPRSTCPFHLSKNP